MRRLDPTHPSENNESIQYDGLPGQPSPLTTARPTKTSSRCATVELWWRSKQLQSRRQRQPAGEAFHLLLHHGLRLAPRIRVSRDDQVFDDVLFFRLEQGGVDRRAFHLALGGQLDHDETAARLAFDLDLVELGLHLLHFRLQLRRLFHQAHEIRHVVSIVMLRHDGWSRDKGSPAARPRHQGTQGSSPSAYRPSGSKTSSAGGSADVSSPVPISAGAAFAGGRTPMISAPGNRLSTACTSGSAVTPRIRSALRASACDFSVGAPCSADTTTIQRRPVHCDSLRESSPTSVAAAPGSSATSSLPSSKATRRTSRSRTVRTTRSRFSPASAIRSSNRATASGAGADAGAGAASAMRAIGSRAGAAAEWDAAAARANGAAVARGPGPPGAPAIGETPPLPVRAAAPEPSPSASDRITSSGLGRSAA